MEKQSLIIGRRVRRLLLGAAWVFCALWAGPACDESLPPREEPPTVLSSSLSIAGTSKTVQIRDSLPSGTTGAIEIHVTNIYDEVLQDSCILDGRAEIWIKSNPEVRTEFSFSANDVVTTGLLSGKILTIGPDVTLVMRHQWSRRTVEGIPIWNYLHLTPGSTMGGEAYCLSDTATFVVRASLRVFKSYGQIQFPDLEFRQVCMVFGIECGGPW